MWSDFREAMDGVHTWSGILLGVIMFVVFFMGTLSVFKDEIDQWMWPDARQAGPVAAVSLDRLYETARQLRTFEARQIRLYAPSDRAPVPSIRMFGVQGEYSHVFVDPGTYEVRGAFDSASASYFLYPMHYRLHLPAGRWIVGAVSMFLLLGLFSGVIIHRKIFVDFFTFRSGKKLPRRSLDLHNLTSILTLPFHIAITLSGLVIFNSLYLLPALEAVFPDESKPRSHVQSGVEPAYGSEPSLRTMLRVSSLDAMRMQAERYWDGQPLDYAIIFHPDDAASYVQMNRVGKTEVAAKQEAVYFKTSSGRVLHEPSITSAGQVQAFIAGMHEIHFDHWLLRWLYFFGGIAGCVMIATGFIYWLESRRAKHARTGNWGVPVVEAVTIWGVMGVLTATAAFFVANRLLPPGMWSSLGVTRLYWEIIAFYAVWLAAIPHGALRGRKAWFDQAVLLALLCALAPSLNWVTTGDHPIRTAATGQWAVTAMDLTLLASAALSAYTAFKLRENQRLARANAV